MEGKKTKKEVFFSNLKLIKTNIMRQGCRWQLRSKLLQIENGKMYENDFR